MSHTRRMLAAAAILSLVAATSCGNVTTSRQEARKQATARTCQRFAQCNLIGDMPLQTYPSDEACRLAWESEWDKRWPAADCDNKINQAELEKCYSAIGGTACTLGDFFNTLGKCDKQYVCGAGADGG